MRKAALEASGSRIEACSAWTRAWTRARTVGWVAGEGVEEVADCAAGCVVVGEEE
jgi:hypothetical protein